MTISARRVAVVGATGPTGIHLVRELIGRGGRVVAVSRREERLRALFSEPEVEIATADALDVKATARAVAGCDTVVDCIGLPPAKMRDHPSTARVVAQAAREASARCLQVSSYWAFMPHHRGEVVSERHARTGGHEWFRLRREAEDVILGAGGAVVHLPDFFGPHVHTSTVQLALEAAVAGKPMSWLGSATTPREAGFVPDLMRIVADLLEREETWGTDWGLPGSGVITAARIAEIAGRHLGRPVKVRAAPAWLLKPLSVVQPGLREIRPLISPYVRPVRYDTSKLHALLGETQPTPFEEAIPRTLDWIAARDEPVAPAREAR